MLRSMYSGISGMKVNQTKLDVIGNNIANVGTTSFKSSKVRFQDMLSQNVKDAMAPSMNQGGMNANQVGLGVQLASIDTVMTQGTLQPTGRALDVAIDGDGFFMVSKGTAIYGDNKLEVSHTAGSHNITEQSLSNTGSKIMFSRDGAFILDESGNLLTADGYRVMGYGLTNDNNALSSTENSPTTVSNSGLDFRFGPGSQLNGYKVVLGKVGPGTITSSEVNVDKKLIIVNGDFSEGSTLTASQVESAVNKGVSSAGISQRVSVIGTPATIGVLGTERISGGTDASAPDAVSLMGATFKFSEGSDLNGIKFQIVNTGAATTTAALVGNVMQITGDFIGGTVDTQNLVSKINSALNTAHKSGSIASVTGSISAMSQYKGTVDNSGVDASAGVTAKSPTAVNVGGVTISLPAKDDFNGCEIQFISQSSAGSVTASRTGSIIKVVGNFNGDITNQQIQDALNNGLVGSNNEFRVSGTLKSMGLESDIINGGVDSKSPNAQGAFDLTFQFKPGAQLNGYNIVLGNISAGTKTTVDIDTNNKSIVVNGDFVTKDAVTKDIIQFKINKALEGKGIDQGVTVIGTPRRFTTAESDTTAGGTPVQSIDEDGSINFVDATKELKAYDGSLKTLRIPDKVKVAGTDEELRVTSYTIDKTGIINAILEDGSVAAVGQIAMASFKNPEGLSKLGGNLYSQSANSGDPSVKSGVGTLGDDNSKGYGTALQGMLEMSNVDLAEQFTDMIVTNRAFQASGKMISTGDEVLQDIINLKR